MIFETVLSITTGPFTGSLPKRFYGLLMGRHIRKKREERKKWTWSKCVVNNNHRKKGNCAVNYNTKYKNDKGYCALNNNKKQGKRGRIEGKNKKISGQLCCQ